MGIAIRTTKRKAIEELGQDYFEGLKDHVDFDELLGSNSIYKCDCCGTWELVATSDGNGEGTMCEDCFDNSDTTLAVKAREFYEKS